MRSVFVRCGIEMLRDSQWYLKAGVEVLPKHGVCLTLDLTEAIRGSGGKIGPAMAEQAPVEEGGGQTA